MSKKKIARKPVRTKKALAKAPKKLEPAPLSLADIVQHTRETLASIGRELIVLDEPASPPERRKFPHLPPEIEKLALREAHITAQLSNKPYKLRLRDLIASAAWPAGITGPFERDPDVADDPGFAPAHLVLEGLADDLEILTLALTSEEDLDPDIELRHLVRLTKRVRAATELAVRVREAGAPLVVRTDEAGNLQPAEGASNG